jgi:hypothetical protein
MNLFNNLLKFIIDKKLSVNIIINKYFIMKEN